MANVKITELTNLTNPSTTDVMPVVDVDADVTKKVSVGEVVGKITGDVEVATDGTATISELPVSKLQDGDARQLLQTDAAGTGVEWTDNVDVPGTLDVTGATTLDSTLDVTGLISADGKVSFPLGTAAAPSLYPGSDTGTGIYSPGANELAISTNGTGRLFVDANGNIGVGTASPSDYNSGADDLVVFNSGDSGITIAAGNTSTGNIFFADGTSGVDRLRGFIKYNHSDNFLSFGTDAGERARIDNSGRLGLGTSSPSSLLHISGSSAGMLRTDRSTDERNHYALATQGTIRGYIGATSANCFEISDNAGASKVTVTNGGNVGIGTTSPSTTLEVIGDAKIGATSYPIRFATGASTGVIEYPATSSRSVLRTLGATPLEFEINSSPVARIDSSGRLLVGTSSALSNVYALTAALSPKLQIQASDNTAHASLIRTAGGGGSYFTLGWGSSGNVATTGQDLGVIQFNGFDGANYRNSAAIICEADDAHASGDTPGRLVFSVTADGASSPTEALRISNDRSITVSDGGDVVLGTTTGTKIGTATSQKIGFYNATPVVQPTTGVAEAAFVENSGGTAVNVDSTFGGYTIQQVVEALQTLGLLA